MKKKVLAIMLLTAMILSSCGKEETPELDDDIAEPVELEQTISAVDISFSNVDWADVDFAKTLDTVCRYSDADIRAMALACAKGVVEKTNCSGEAAYEASVEVISNLRLKAADIKELIVLDVSTLNSEEKERALLLTSDFIASLREINDYIDLSEAMPEQELTSIIEYQPVTTEAETVPVALEISIDWDSEAFITSMEHFAAYDSETLKQISDQYAEGLARLSGMAKDDILADVKKEVRNAKQNAVAALELYELKNTWTDATKAAADSIASEFVRFVNDFKMYSAALSENPDASQEEDSEDSARDSESDTSETMRE